MITTNQISITKQFGTWNLVVGMYLIMGIGNLKFIFVRLCIRRILFSNRLTFPYEVREGVRWSLSSGF
jgi:hypothetical protein